MVEHLDKLRPQKGKPYHGRIRDGGHYALLVREHKRDMIIQKRERILLELERRHDMRIGALRAKERVPQRKQPPIADDVERCDTDYTKGLRVPPKAKAVIGTVLSKYGMHWSAVISESRKQPLVHIRFEMWDLLSRTGYSLPMIGKMFGRDHTTILHGVRVINGTQRDRNAERARRNARPVCGSEQRQPDDEEGNADRSELELSAGGATRIAGDDGQ